MKKTISITRRSSFFWMNMVLQCRKHMLRDMEMNLQLLLEAYIIQLLRQYVPIGRADLEGTTL